jgi:hypothetical protein
VRLPPVCCTPRHVPDSNQNTCSRGGGGCDHDRPASQAIAAGRQMVMYHNCHRLGPDEGGPGLRVFVSWHSMNFIANMNFVSTSKAS